MSVMTVVRSGVGAALLVNAVPHGVSGVRGKPFPSPVGDPPGVGLSPPRTNIGWSVVNAVAGVLLLRRGIRSPGEAIGAAVGALVMTVVISFHFSDVLGGGTGLRGMLNSGSAARRSGPPRALVKATEPIAITLAGRRGVPLWAVIHHRGRKSGAAYSTPVAVVPTADPTLVLIGLPWGPRTNWALNVVAAGTAELTFHGARRSTTSPSIVECTEAAPLAKPLFRRIVRLMPAAIVLRRSQG